MVNPVVKITIEQDGQTLDEIAMRIYGYALKAVEEVVNKMTKEEEVVVNKAAEEILN